MITLLRVGVLAAGLLLALIANVRAEVKQITVAQQHGVSFLPLMLMEKEALVERHAAAAGLTELKVSWAKLARDERRVDFGVDPVRRAGCAVDDPAL